ncbi:hypothetical protein PF005_g10101 [Phytophthora fragariae]|uniref:DDE-1 domain-containing protein n=1 Tax=Phytophthora fragariae TaxID=53985 RepID=A0A6A3U2W3_9STRA|nr:hypothetical protein PF006_g9348 [Phytophthora fragariae]KAE9213708.1 hypothetical protein PF005_g10101 [Phytophthora fragariae]
MIRHPKNKNKVKLKALDRGTKTVIAASAAVGVHRSTWYRWKGQETVIKSAAEDAPAKSYTHRSTEMYIGNPSLEKKFLDWIVEMRKNRYLCVSMECLLLMLGLRIYLTYHLENRFPTTTSEKRSLISRFVVEAWAEVKPETLVKGFARAGVIPTGPRDRDGRFRVPAAVPDAPVVQDN